jgi:hypothetical protein
VARGRGIAPPAACPEESARRSVSRVLSRPKTGMAIHLGRPLPNASRDRPERRRERPARRFRPKPARLPLLLGLAPGGVCPAAAVAAGAVRSYRTISPLPPLPSQRPTGARRCVSVALSLGSPPPGVIRHRASVEPGLSSPGQRELPRPGAAIRPSGMRSDGIGPPQCQSRQALFSVAKSSDARQGSRAASARPGKTAVSALLRR